MFGEVSAARGAEAVGSERLQLPDPVPQLPPPVPVGLEVGLGVLPFPMPFHGLVAQVSTGLGDASPELQKLCLQVGHRGWNVFQGPELASEISHFRFQHQPFVVPG